MLLALIATWTMSFAQGRPDGPPRGERGPLPIEKLQADLDLTDEQVTQLEQLRDETREAMQELRDKGDRNREGMRTLLEAQKEQMESILTEEQRTQLEAMRPKNRPQLSEEKRNQLKAEVEAYRQNNIEPILQQQRAKLDEKIAPENQALIEELRTLRPAKGERPTDEQRQAMRDHQDDIQYLLKTYSPDIRELFEEIKSQAEQWQADLRAIHEQYRPEDAPEKGSKRGHKDRKHRQGGRHGQDDMGMLRPLHFLLMHG